MIAHEPLWRFAYRRFRAWTPTAARLPITSRPILRTCNTVGFKTSTADFSTFLAATGQADPHIC